MEFRVVIVGAGVSGLATAVNLLNIARRTAVGLRLTVLEAEPRAGGRMWSDREDGYVVEHGPNGFLDSKPDALELAASVDLQDRLLRASAFAKKRFICRRGRLRRLPESPWAFLASRLLTFRGKARVLWEPFVRAAPNEDETLQEFATRRLGREALEYLIDPMVSGVFAGDPARLSLRASFPRIYELERDYGGLFRAMFRLMREKKRSGPAGPGGTLTSFVGGVRTLVETLQALLADRIVLSAPVTRLRRTASGFEVESPGLPGPISTDAVVLACPAFEAARLCEPDAPALARELAGIEYAPVTVVATAFRRDDVPHPLDGFGFLVPRSEARPILGTLWDSSVFSDRAPPGRVLLRTMVGGARAPELAALPDRDLIGAVRTQLADYLGIRSDPERVWVYRHPRGIPQYVTGHLERLARMDAEVARTPGLFLCHNAYRGIALNDCAREARVTASRVLEYLGFPSAPSIPESRR